MEQIDIVFLDYKISSNKALLQPAAIHRYLSEEAYWSKNIPAELVETAIYNSFCIGIYHKNEQVGFARLITDYATFAYLADVYVLTEHRGKGVSKAMMTAIMNLHWVKGLRRFTLTTLDAHGLYSQYGFEQPAHPERLMEITRPGIYGDTANKCS